MPNFLTYADLLERINSALKLNSGSKDDLVKQIINHVYLNEICNADSLYPLKWLVRGIDSKKTVAPSVITGITQADPADITTGDAHGYAVGDLVRLDDIVGMTELNGRMVRVGAVGTTTTFEAQDINGDAIDSSAFTAYGSGGTSNWYGSNISTRRVLSITLPEENIQLEPIGIDDFNSQSGYYLSDTQAPSKYMYYQQFNSAGVDVSYLMFLPSPNAEFKPFIWHESLPDRLSADADVPILPFGFHDTIVAGAMSRLAELDNIQIEDAVVWPQLYALQLDSMKKYNRSLWEQEERTPKAFLA